MHRLTDLREILQYVPHFRDRVFVVAVDGAIIADPNFATVMLDFALLRSLRIWVVLVHGAGLQVRQLAAKEGIRISSSDGTGVTNAETLQITITAATRVTHQVLQGLADADLRGACGNAVVAHPAGILGGVDHMFTGRVERIDTAMLRSLLDHDIIPVISPLGCDGEGHSYRLNSDAVAVEVAKALQAVKLIYLAAHRSPRIGSKVIRHVSVEDAANILRRRAELSPQDAASKLENAVKACKGGVPRVHIVDGTLPEGLLSEVFSNDGVGTLVHTNEYQSIRKAQKKDVRAIHELIKRGIEAEELVKRTRADVERNIDDFFVFVVDQNPVACVALHLYPETQQAEVACLYVDDRHENQGLGGKLLHYAENAARQRGAAQLFCLSTQAINYFVQKGAFQLATPDTLPPGRRDSYERSGRNSQVLVKPLG